jgi:hypothetical protein
LGLVDPLPELVTGLRGGRLRRRFRLDDALLEGVEFCGKIHGTSWTFVDCRYSLLRSLGTHRWSDDQRRARPAAGLVYRFETDATRRPAEPIRPDPSWCATAIAGS